MSAFIGMRDKIVELITLKRFSGIVTTSVILSIFMLLF